MIIVFYPYFVPDGTAPNEQWRIDNEQLGNDAKVQQQTSGK